MERQGRPYRDGRDWVGMRQLLMVGGRADVSGSYMHPGCLDWAICYPPDEQANRRNFWLWERIDGDGATLEAWAIFLRREGSFDLFVHSSLYDTPRHETIMDAFVGWAEGRARGFAVIEVDLPPPLFERPFLPTPHLPPTSPPASPSTASKM